MRGKCSAFQTPNLQINVKKTQPIHNVISIYLCVFHCGKKCGSQTKEVSLSSAFLEGELSDIRERVKQQIKNQVSQFSKIKQQRRGRQEENSPDLKIATSPNNKLNKLHYIKI